MVKNIMQILDNEGKLLNIINSIEPIKWRKYQLRKIEIWDGEKFVPYQDRYTPYISFEFQSLNNDLINKITNLIDIYHGSMKWIIYPVKNKWVICPKLVFDLQNLGINDYQSLQNYIYETIPYFISEAFDDLQKLTDFLNKNIYQPNKQA